MLRPYDPASNASSSSANIPIPTFNPPPLRKPTQLKRGKTLTRPERGQKAPPLITPPAPFHPGLSKQSFPLTPSSDTSSGWSRDWWVILSIICTFWAPPSFLHALGKKDTLVRQAWREKITLCLICLFFGGCVAFITMGLQAALCPAGAQSSFQAAESTSGVVGIEGWSFNISSSVVTSSVNFYTIAKAYPGQDISNDFLRHTSSFPACSGFTGKFATTPMCQADAVSGVSYNGTLQSCPLPALNSTTLNDLKITNNSIQVGYTWDQVSSWEHYMVIDGNVLNMYPYLAANRYSISGDYVDLAIRTVLKSETSGRDATRLFYNRKDTQAAVPCLVSRYYAGHIDKTSPGCMIASIFLYLSLGIILGIIAARFVMACIFTWFISPRVCKPLDSYEGKISPMVMPEGGNRSVGNRTGTAPWNSTNPGGVSSSSRKLQKNNHHLALPPTNTPQIISAAQIGAELFTVCLVTCYSESLESIKGTCDSIALTTYSDSRKLMIIVADGMVTGSGETISTPDICVGLLEADERFGNPIPMGYIAVGSGRKGENRAMVYAGHYVVSKNGRRARVPTIVIVKCGMPFEATEAKPGNRGKRDSQLILMNFFSKVTYNDRMSPLDFDLFRKIQTLMGVTPDFFETVLMVDADTVITEDSLTHLVNCMQHDNMVMGVCGETRVANKRQNYITMIQVYEYFISHHMAKAFEASFGGVTCLPGCFSMYRLKSRKAGEDDWIPIITKPEIVSEYSQSDVVTLHQKNLLLLGEDRFLSTLMLRTFPNRKMMFCPQARCRTVVPDTFAILLSQRRRWINSTVHNLMELIRVRNLCGTFCFSMQAVVFMDLVGTITLPVAICLTLVLIIRSIINPPTTFEAAIPLFLLGSVLGLPGILILITTGKLIYVAWMFIYFSSLPIWNFILPVYSFWHFDDFSWGETRKVIGDLKGIHEDDKTVLVASIPLRRWEDWERSRLRKLKREERRQRDLAQMERQFEAVMEGDAAGGLYPHVNGRATSDYEGSDTTSMFSTEDDAWGAQIGQYNENAAAFPPPPLVFDLHATSVQGQVLGKEELEAMLDQGFEDPPSSYSNPFTHPGFSHSNSSSSIGSNNSNGGSPSGRSLVAPHMPRYQLADSTGMNSPRSQSPLNQLPTMQYIPLSSPVVPEYGGTGTSAIELGHAKKRSVSTSTKPYGPGGPLLDASNGGRF